MPFPSPGDLPDPGIEPRPPALQAYSLLTELRGKPHFSISPSSEYSGLIPFRIERFDLAVQGSPKSLLQLRNSKASILRHSAFFRASLVAQRVKCLPTMQETWVQFLGQEDPLEKEMATHSSILAWRIPWTEESGRVQSHGVSRVGHN